VFFVRQQLIDFIGGDPTDAEKKLDQEGYVVKTSLDLEAQGLAESVMQDMGPSTVKKYGASNAALTAVDPKTGEVLAMVGSIDYEDSKSGNTNYANALLQPGSSFKPFVYATTFDKVHKKSPASIFFDLQTDFGNYVPQNYDGRFRGPVTIRNSLAQSLNIPAVKALENTGIKDAIGTATRLGISSLTNTDAYGLSLVLGAGEVRPVEMANAYAGFANGGKHNNLRPILTIEKDGKMVKDFRTDEPTQALEPEVAYQITSILSDNNARTPVFGARNNLTLSDRPVAAKSGTTNSNRDAWTVGFTPQISVAVWVGNNEANKTMVKGADGSIVAAPIWKRYMQEYLKGKPIEQFTRPEGLKDVTIDMLSGKLPTDQSPSDQRITDMFAEWQIPTDFDDVHTKVKIDRVTGKLATDITPPEDIEELVYFYVHSEHPDNPNWEGPVQAWAAANGGNSRPPT
jgi:membrane peptidoglycan carboxypeptidase